MTQSQTMDDLWSRGFCCMIGTSRIGRYDARIFPREQDKHTPVVITEGKSLADALEAAVTKLGDRKPGDKCP